jgi:hypothetical protein
MTDEQTVPLDLLDRSTIRRRARNVGIVALVIGSALGGIVGLFAGPTGFFATAAIVAAPLLLLAYSESRKTYWLDGSRVAARAFGTRVVDLARADKLDVLITDVRGARTVGLLAAGPPKGKALNVALAMYAGAGGKELGVYSLRRLADALASTGDTRALVLSELLVAQLRSEARGDSAAERPLYRLATMAQPGRMAQKIRSEDVARFVAAMD